MPNNKPEEKKPEILSIRKAKDKVAPEEGAAESKSEAVAPKKPKPPEAPAASRSRASDEGDRKPSRKRPYRKPSGPPSIDLAKNSEGEEFHAGDEILVNGCFGLPVSATINRLYQDSSGEAWASFQPNEEEAAKGVVGGCVHSSFLRHS
ncbi:hypothetical protein [Phormidium sp. CCY1219]|uniref:hypothetical protein n=1 Tax=Phormidium sp. CCY1219 TaxID=2886104 RepID=UPI002D1F12AB|nr:hypothetical protein [Phormidium sp. CCY1219]MEB3826985.1 hypothetical protein [Phormidium sp. CCY1219]